MQKGDIRLSLFLLQKMPINFVNKNITIYIILDLILRKIFTIFQA